jgi:T5SS/PEP-CTERM-associated repeat protein
VNFDLGAAATNPYVVTDVSGQNNQLIVHNDSVELNVFPSYTLLSAGGANPSLVVGAGTGDTAMLTLSGSDASLLETDVTRIGNAANTTAIVNALGLQWSGENLRVGHVDDANGTLLIEEDAAISSTNLSIGHLDGAIGNLFVNNGTLTTTGNFLIGREGSGSLDIVQFGTVMSASAMIGSESTGQGDVRVSGQFATWTIHNTLTIAGVGDAEVLMFDGTITNMDAIVGDLPGSDGFVLVDFGFEWKTSGRLKIGGDTIGGTSGGSGLVRMDGGTVQVGGELVISPNGVLDFQGGTLTARLVAPEGTGQFDWTGGIYNLDQFNGNLVNQGGALIPDEDVEDPIINGNYTQEAGGRIQFEILGAAEDNLYNTLDVTGTMTLGGTLELSGATLYEPNSDEVYPVIQAGDIIGSFDNVASGERVENSRGSFVVYYGPGSPFDPDHVVLTDFQFTLIGDYNGNDVVDAADYVVWRERFGTTFPLLNDPIDGTIGPAHYDQWRARFGQVAGGGSSSTHPLNPSPVSAVVPEPGPLAVFVSVFAILAAIQCRRRRIIWCESTTNGEMAA